MRLLFFAVALLAFNAHAWMEAWAPEFKASHVEMQKLSAKSVKAFACKAMPDGGEFRAEYSEGGMVDLNNDGIKDFVFIIPWMGNGLNANLNNVHFIVSDGAQGRIETVLDAYGADLEDVVTLNGKVYYRMSSFVGPLERSEHNHWVYQIFSFGTNGVMQCANKDFKEQLPAATIFYNDPKFKRVELTSRDQKKIVDETKFETRKYL